MRECSKTDKNDLDTVAEILRAATKGAKKAEIIGKCNLNHKALEKYLYVLVTLNLIKVEQKGENLYRTTDKGLQLMRTYYHLKALLGGKTYDLLLVRLLSQLIANRTKDVEDVGRQHPQPQRYIV